MIPDKNLQDQFNRYLNGLIRLENSESNQLLQRGRWTYYKNNIQYRDKSDPRSLFETQKLEKILSIMSRDLERFHSSGLKLGKEEKSKLTTLRDMVNAKVEAYRARHQGVTGQIYKTISNLFYGNVDQWSQKVLAKIDLLLGKEGIEKFLEYKDEWQEDNGKGEVSEGEEAAVLFGDSFEEKFTEEREDDRSIEEMEEDPSNGKAPFSELELTDAINIFLTRGKFDTIGFMLKINKKDRSKILEILISHPHMTDKEIDEIAKNADDMQLVDDYHLKKLEALLAKAVESGNMDVIADIIQQNKIGYSRLMELLAPQMETHGEEINQLMGKVES